MKNTICFARLTLCWVLSVEMARAQTPGGPVVIQPGESAPGNHSLVITPKDVITESINPRVTSRLPFSVHPKARPESDAGPVSDDFTILGMTLVLRRSSDQQAALDALLAAQQNPQSPEYHKWLSPEEFGARFGLSQSDIDKLTAWLQESGFAVDEVPKGRWTILFSGTAGQVRTAFHTQIHYYNLNGARHLANSIPLRIPRAFSQVVEGVLGINDFQPVPTARKSAEPNLASGNSHYLAPSDYATVYNINPLYSAGIDGSGQSIAIVGRCNIDLSKVQTFRVLAGLNPNDTTVSVVGQAPAPCTASELLEPYLDVEWAGAVAKNAKIILVIASSIGDAALYIVNNNLAPVMSTSFGSCEANNQGGGNQFWSNLWQQASSHGITSLVSSGDSGAAGCDGDADSSFAVHGSGVNAICSTPYNVCVGGTEFDDSSNPSQYWSSQGRALGYIPEKVWNESGSDGGSGLWATGGGFSSIYPKSMAPWQTGNTSVWRGVPDVSLAAAQHDGYFVCEDGSCTLSNFYFAAGTSASAPSFAGLMALVVQKTGQRQGNANPAALYALASRNDVYHDIVSGNNGVPGLNGYSAGIGWDPVTGLGSVDANSMVTHWGAGAGSTPSLLLSANAVSFGNQIIGTTSPSQTVTVTSNGTASVNISAISLNGATVSDFPSTTTCPNPGQLAAGRGCAVTIAFKPTASGARTASIALADDAPGSPHIISLSGTGIPVVAPPTVVHALTSTANGLSSGNCSLPVETTNFSTTSSAVWLYFEVSGANSSDSARMSFIRPDGVVSTNLTATTTYSGNVCFSYYIPISGSAAASYPGKWAIQTFWNQFTAPLFTLNFTISPASPSGPVINQNGIVNNASQADGTTSGGFISIYGTRLSTQGSQSWNIMNDQLPTTTAGTQVLINGKLAYLAYVSPTLINAIVPVDSAVGPVSVQVVTSAGISAAVTVNKKAVAPALFMIVPGGFRYAASILPDGAYAIPAGLVPGAPARAARPGEVVALWATGLGPTTPQYPDGKVVTVQNRGVLASPYSLLVGGKPAQVDFAGLVFAGGYQVNFHVPQLPAGDATVVLTVAGVPTQTAYIYVGQ
jgi:pseudomonalisin